MPRATALLPALYLLAGASGTVFPPTQREVVIELGSNLGDWITPYLIAHPHAIPILVEPQPRFASNLDAIARSHGGSFYPAAAWSSNVESMLFFDAVDGDANVGSSVIAEHATRVVESEIGEQEHRNNTRTKPRVEQLSVAAVDIAEVVRRHTRPGDTVTLRMDIEGAEYEVLRHLLVTGVACTIDHYLVESHSLYTFGQERFIVVDLLLPWLLEGCRGRKAPPTLVLEAMLMHTRRNTPGERGSASSYVPGCEHCPLVKSSTWWPTQAPAY